MSVLLVDTDILSAVMRQNPIVLPHARKYLAGQSGFTISVITKYEIERGLKARSALKQQAVFEELCRRSVVVPVDNDVADRASSIYAHLVSRGELIGDADILIAATAIVHQIGLVTNNRRHFDRVPGLQVENWME
jgi:tRNA(fMet)-specific endonuclease VapC